MAAGIEVHVTAVRSVSDVAPALTELAGRVEVEVEVEVAPPAPARSATGRVAFVPIWRRPWMTLNVDTYGASVLGQLGWSTAFGDAADRYPEVELDDVLRVGVDLAVVPTEPYAFEERHRQELEAELGCRALLVDGKDLFWWGDRTPAAIDRLQTVLA